MKVKQLQTPTPDMVRHIARLENFLEVFFPLQSVSTIEMGPFCRLILLARDQDFVYEHIMGLLHLVKELACFFFVLPININR